MLVAFTYDLSRALVIRDPLYSPLTKEKITTQRTQIPQPGETDTLPTVLCFQRALHAFARLPVLP